MLSLQNAALKGIIATATVGSETGGRDLRAITIGHINRSLSLQGEGGLVPLLQGELAVKATVFAATVAPAERAALQAALGH